MEPKKARQLHNKLTSALDNHVGGYDDSMYKNLVNRMKEDLTLKEQKEAKNIMDILVCLQRKGIIDVGKYQYLKEVFDDVDKTVNKNIIEPIEKDIQKIQQNEYTMSSGKDDKAGKIKQEDKPSQLAPATDNPGTQCAKTYAIEQRQKGFLLILNVMSKEREGSAKDVENLTQFFKGQLGFTVFNKEDMTLDTVHATLEQTKNTLTGIDGDSYYCFVCVVMSHGGKEGILTTDRKMIPMDTIVDKFKNTEFKEFIGKPKVFLVQACRGGSVQQVARHEHVTDDEIEEDLPFVTGLKDADILIAYATTDGHVSYRNTMHGSWFIGSLLKVFQEFYNKHHVEEMLVSVRCILACDENYQREVRNKIRCQMPCTWTTLTKLFFLKAAVAT